MSKPTGKPRGRPKAAEPGSSLSTHLSASEHDQLIRLAKQHDQTVSRFVRSVLRLALRGVAAKG
jgi:hypothetical protein